jgi:hypothetical protein
MKQIKSSLGYPLLLGLVMLSSFYSCEAKTKYLSSDINLVASTPGDEGIKSLLAISPGTKVDFIRWNLILTSAISANQQFTLNINYGEAQPNTLGFKNGGEKKSIAGEYTISQDTKSINGEVYHLKSTSLPSPISIVKLGDNVYHFLTHQKQLMVGNAGWSYTLNRKEPLTNVSSDFPSLAMLSDVPEDTSQQIIFVGRTPCFDIAKEQNLTVPLDCIKLKWDLILNRDPKTLKPATYTLRRTDHRQSDLTGKWTIKKGISSNPHVVIYELDPDKPEQSISLLLGDENVAFLLNKDNNFFTGNENFSYTLNREKK